MTFIIITLCVALISGIITTFMNEAMLNGLYDIVFHGDITMVQSTGANFFTTVTGIAFTFAMSLMVLKFLKRVSTYMFCGLTATRTQTPCCF